VRDDESGAVRGILERAEAETRALGYAYVGSEHLLLALLDSAGSRAAQRLEAAGARYEDVGALIVRILGPGEEEIAENQILPYTTRAGAIVHRVRGEADRAGPAAIGTEHILRALLRRRDSLAVQILEDCGVDTVELADQLRRARPDDE
jgi:ATP-dependent Clp protease ATP-binding subunit ClpC